MKRTLALLAFLIVLCSGCGTLQEFGRVHGPDILRGVVSEIREELPRHDATPLERATRLGLDLLIRYLTSAKTAGGAQ
jgi:hypothetical protein